MNAPVAKIVAVTIIVVSLLATATVLSLRGASDVAQAAVFTALGTALPLVFRWLTSSSSSAEAQDKGGPGAATVLLVVGSVLASHAAGCATPPVELPVVSVEAKQKAAGATFGADLLECVDNNKTDEAIDACADSVRVYWRRKDGGK